IGHTQAAAGVGGVIKMVQAMRHGTLPRTLHIEEPTRIVDWDSGAVELLTEERDWPQTGDRPRRAAVSSFGMGGTNAHVIIEQAPEPEPASDESRVPVPAMPLVLSAKTPQALAGQAQRLVEHLEHQPALDLTDVAHSLTTTRAEFDERAVVVADGTGDEAREQVLDRLRALADGRDTRGLARGTAVPRAKTVFVFAGQGSQWAGMAVELLETSPVFAARFAECAAAVEAHVDWSVEDVLRARDGAPSLDRVEIVQAVLFSVHVALAELWRSHGIEPDAVVGHSQGEIAAAAFSGALTLEDAARIVVVRSQLFADELLGRGGVASVALSLSDIGPWLEPYGELLSIAGVNSPSMVTVAGDQSSLEELVAALSAQEIRARVIPASVASHSAQVEPLRERLSELLAFVEPRTGDVPLYSTVTGEVMRGPELTASYWYENCRRPVNFEPVVRTLLADGFDVFVEPSAHPVLTFGMAETIEHAGAEAAVVGTLRRGRGGLEQFRTALGEAYVNGLAVDWESLVAGSGARVVELPAYAFQRSRYWLESTAAIGDASGLGLVAADHPLLGATVGVAGRDETVFTGRLSLRTHPWLSDHRLHDGALLPGTGFIELALRAGDHVDCPHIEELTLAAPLMLPDHGDVRVQVVIGEADGSGRRRIGVYSRPDDEAADEQPWLQHAEGLLAPDDEQAAAALPAADDLLVWPPAEAQEVELGDVYERLLEHGYGYGPAFQGLRRVWHNDTEIFAEVTLTDDERARAGEFLLHPALLDAALHSLLPGVTGPDRPALLPFSWSGVTLHATAASTLRVRLASSGNQSVSLDIADGSGAPVATVDRLGLRPLTKVAEQNTAHDVRGGLFRVGWTALPANSGAESADWVLLGGADTVSTLGVTAPSYAGLTALGQAVEAGETLPRNVLLPLPALADTDRELPEQAHQALQEILQLAQAWLEDDRFAGARLVVVTRGAVAVGTE
ncbi:acyltransferase domain-containing protein, partial [Streptomyces violascens]|uniref:acyltransferase domain-containing protein n=1 Tax=Streptomyces violascens TaxID=67381 RepID=UPI0036574244